VLKADRPTPEAIDALYRALTGDTKPMTAAQRAELEAILAEDSTD
jgi:hypothetical protein